MGCLRCTPYPNCDDKKKYFATPLRGLSGHFASLVFFRLPHSSFSLFPLSFFFFFLFLLFSIFFFFKKKVPATNEDFDFYFSKKYLLPMRILIFFFSKIPPILKLEVGFLST